MSVLVIPANPFLLLRNLINVQGTENLTFNIEVSLSPLPTSEYVFYGACLPFINILLKHNMARQPFLDAQQSKCNLHDCEQTYRNNGIC